MSKTLNISLEPSAHKQVLRALDLMAGNDYATTELPYEAIEFGTPRKGGIRIEESGLEYVVELVWSDKVGKWLIRASMDGY